MSKGDKKGRPAGGKLQGWQKTLASWCHEYRWQLGGIFAFLVLALYLTWPTLASPFSRIPMGSEPAPTVALTNTWITWWNADRLLGLFAGYWNAPIFFPTPGALAMNEPQPTTLMVAPVLWLTGSRILAYNVYVWLSLVLNGFFAQRLARTYGMGHWAAIWAGAAMVLLPMVNWQLGISHLVPVWGFLWVWLAVERLCREPSRARGVELGVAVGVAFVTCMHQGLLFAVLLVGAAPTLWRQLSKVRDLAYWGIAVVIALLIVGPFAYKIFQVTAEHALDLDPIVVTNLSATLGDYLQAYGGQIINTTPAQESFRLLSPGWIKIVLAFVGIFYGLRHVETRRWAGFLLAMAVLAFLLSFGTNLKLGGWQPWSTLTEIVPGLGQVRSVLRFAFFVHMAVVVFAAFGLVGLYRTICERAKNPKALAALQRGLVILALVVLVEVFPKRGANATVTDVSRHRGWIEYVREHTPRGYGIVCLPVAPGQRVGDFMATSEWMYLGTFHRVPIINGYATQFPLSYWSIRDQILAGFPTPDILRQLYDRRVRFLVVRAARGGPARDGTIGGFSLRRVFVDDLVEVYLLSKAGG